MSASELANLTQPLIAFSQALGDALPHWDEREERYYIRYESEAIGSDLLRNLEFEHVQSLARSYGNALSCRFLIGDEVVLDQNSFLGEHAFEQFRKELLHQPSLGFDFLLDKRKLLQEILGDPPDHLQYHLYFFGNALNRLFQKSELSDLEKQLWEERKKKAVIFVLDTNVSLSGALLEITGGENLSDWQAEKKVSDVPLATSFAQSVYTHAKRLLRWQRSLLQYLTPDYLFLEGESENRELILAINAHLVNSVLLYTANRTVERSGEFISTYDGTRDSVAVPFAQATDLRLIDKSNIEALYHIYHWAYEDERRVAERLFFVQSIAVQTLKAAQEKDRCRLLVHNAPAIYSDLQWHWKGFIENIVEQYTEQVRQLEDYVSETIQAFAAQISEMAKTLTDTMLAAVAVLIGSFIAALFSSDFNAAVFRIGMWTYAGYVFFFSLLYNMASQWSRFQAVVGDFGERQQRFENYLGREKVKQLATEGIEKSKNSFLKWFWLTVVLYFCLAILGLFAGLYVPEAIQNQESPSPISAPPINSSPTPPATTPEITSGQPVSTFTVTPDK